MFERKLTIFAHSGITTKMYKNVTHGLLRDQFKLEPHPHWSPLGVKFQFSDERPIKEFPPPGIVLNVASEMMSNSCRKSKSCPDFHDYEDRFSIPRSRKRILYK